MPLSSKSEMTGQNHCSQAIARPRRGSLSLLRGVRTRKIKLKMPDDLLSASPEEIKSAYERARTRQRSDPVCGAVLLSIAIGFIILMVAVRYSHVGSTGKIILGLLICGVVGAAWGIASKYLTLRLIVQELRKGCSNIERVSTSP